MTMTWKCISNASALFGLNLCLHVCELQMHFSKFECSYHNKGGTNLEFHLNRISNRISSKFLIRIEYEYSVASNLIRILNVEISCRDAVSSTATGTSRARVVGIMAIRIDLFVYFLT